MTTPSDLIALLERLRNMLIQRATGGHADEHEYSALRRTAVAEERLYAKLPTFIQTCRTPNDFWSFIKAEFGSYEDRRQFLRQAFEPILEALEEELKSPGDNLTSAVLAKVDSDHVQDAWRKALSRRLDDPDGAITVARSLIKSVCKHILDQTSTPYEDHSELPKLYALVAQRLNLSPAQHTEQLFKQILGGCQTVVEGVAAIRNRLSDAHGKGRRGLKPSPRHAELAVNLAGAMAIFLLGSWESQRQKTTD